MEAGTMSDNLAYQEITRDEMINGKVILMSPRPTVNQNVVMGRLYRFFGNYLDGKKCMPFADGTDVYLSETDRVIPDVMVVCDRNKIKRTGVYGAPDLVIEVLSPGTEARDRGAKKDLYEKHGVREYWLVEPETRTVEVYLLDNGKFRLDDVYRIFPDYIELSDEEKKQYKSDVRVSIYDDFSIPLEKIFQDLL